MNKKYRLQDLVPDGSTQPRGAGGAVGLALDDDVGHPDGGLVTEFRQGAEADVPRLEAVGIQRHLDAAGAELFEELRRAPISQLLEVAVAFDGLAVLGLDVPGVHDHLPALGPFGLGVARPDHGPVFALASAQHEGHVGVAAVAEGPAGLLQAAPPGREAVVGVGGGPPDLEHEFFAAVFAGEHHPEAQITGRTHRFEVVKQGRATGLLLEGGVKALRLGYLQLGPRSRFLGEGQHGGLGILVLDGGRGHPLGVDPRGRVAGDDEVGVLVLVAPVADAHGDFDRCVGADEPAALPQEREVLLGGADFQSEAAFGVVGLIPVHRHPHVDIAQPGKGRFIQDVECQFITSGRMPTTIG